MIVSSVLQKKSRPLATVICGFAMLVLSGLAHAIPIDFTYDADNSSASFANGTLLCLGCNPQVNTRTTDLTFTLDSDVQPAEFAFNFLTVSADNNSLNLGFGQTDLNATLAFSAPSSGGTATTSGTATFVSALVFQSGTVSWDPTPSSILFDDGTSVDVVFGGGTAQCTITFFNNGCSGGLSFDVSATTTLTGNPNAVPEPTGLALLGVGAVALGVTSRRRRISIKR